ncbi:glycine zipper 2TM domain-containing protein [Entomomonas sp. E2T0]|uniref:glycine zipper 2TM domain-containing protein n=1 Tax=Entomomonas sp. E2T0 TaxID=2930213 RepID=UPI002228202F|nr:glycine zipper 2TM domain-containing protein [Entomomonas sp. E2T0]UYZ84538.1 glycine zipper 2TM domain-containing protein [Entomomonas sp. E2T0]
MDKSLIIGLVAGIGIASAAGALATFSIENNKVASNTEETQETMKLSESAKPQPNNISSNYAKVIAITPVTKTVKTPQQNCRNVTVTHQQPVKDEYRLIGTVAGAAIGGVLGNQVGGGNGKKVATVVGTVGGGLAGNKVQEHMQNNSTYTTTEKQCETTYESTEKPAGYEVKYSLNGTDHDIHMDYDPGSTIPVDNQGRLIIKR